MDGYHKRATLYLALFFAFLALVWTFMSPQNGILSGIISLVVVIQYFNNSRIMAYAIQLIPIGILIVLYPTVPLVFRICVTIVLGVITTAWTVRNERERQQQATMTGFPPARE